MSKFIRIYELAKIKGVRRQSIYRWIRENKIPKEKMKKEIVHREMLFIDESVIENELKNYPKKSRNGHVEGS